MQIQIRVWDTIEQKMIYNAEESIDLCSYVSSKRYCTMLGTSKYDTNGRQIYCGDMIKSTNYLLPSTLYVAWNDKNACFCLRDEEGRDYAFCTSFELTIVGNIYEGVQDE